MKKIWNSYKKPTPKKWRKLGDSIMAVSVFIGTATVSIPHVDKWIPLASVILGVFGKFLTNFFSVKEHDGGEVK
jgi:hypothetical protein